jgi:hypothetical protein
MLPIKQLSPTSAPNTFRPIQIAFWAVTTFIPALSPRAILKLPEVLYLSARTPTAVLPEPVVLFVSAFKPMAVFESPVVLLKSASAPTAVLALLLLLFYIESVDS